MNKLFEHLNSCLRKNTESARQQEKSELQSAKTIDCNKTIPERKQLWSLMLMMIVMWLLLRVKKKSFFCRQYLPF